MKKYREWLFGFKVIIHSDHNLLTFLTESAPKSSELMRWSLALAKYDIEFKYHARKLNIAADSLSRKNLAKIFYANRVIAHFVLNFVAMATRVGREKMQLAAFDGSSPKPPYRRKKTCKNLLRKPSYSPFCPKFRCHGNQKKFWVKLNNTVRLAISKNHTIEPNITTLSYTQPKL